MVAAMLAVVAEEHSEASHEMQIPVTVTHFRAVRVKPHDVLEGGAADFTSLEKIGLAKNGMLEAELDQFFCKILEGV